MIDLFIAILIGLSTNTACDLGTSLDWYEWANNHPAAYVYKRFEFDDSENVDDVYLYRDEATDTYVLFVFKDDISDAIAAGEQPHGRCSRVVVPGEE